MKPIEIIAEFNVFDENENEYLVTVPYNWTPSAPVSRDFWGCPLEPDDDGGSIFYKVENISVFSIENGKHTKLDNSQQDPILEIAFKENNALDLCDLIWGWHNQADIYQYISDPDPEYADK